MASSEYRASSPPKVPRSTWALLLHRQPTRWDVLFHRLAEAICRRYWHTQAHFRNSVMRLDADELADAAMQMSRAFAKETSLAGIAELAGERQLSLFDLAPDTLLPIADAARGTMIRALTNYLEIAHNCFIPRNHPDVEMIRPRLQETLERFLQDKCLGDGELAPCIREPLGDDEGYFPAANPPRPFDPASSSGNARLDAYRLNVLVHDADGETMLKAKLLDFVKLDPFVGPEFTVDLMTRLATAELQAQNTKQKLNARLESVRIRDRFLFTPCHQRGLLPVELFLEQQVLASDRQKERLRRWAEQHVEGVFRMVEAEGDRYELEDISSGRRAVVVGEANPSLAAEPLITSRLVPWDDHWLFSGMQQAIHVDGPEEELRRMLHPLRVHRRVDEDDPRLQAARELVRFVHERFIAHFGHEIAPFANLDECRQKLGEFHHELLTQARLPDGRQFADAYVTDVGMEFPPYFQDRFASSEENVSSPAVIYDSVEGMAFIGFFDDIRLAMTSPFPNQQQKDAIKRLLVQSWTPGWLVRRLLMENPVRAEELLREILGGETFAIAKNLEPLLARLKCPLHTLPHRPVPFLAD